MRERPGQIQPQGDYANQLQQLLTAFRVKGYLTVAALREAQPYPSGAFRFSIVIQDPDTKNKAHAEGRFEDIASLVNRMRATGPAWRLGQSGIKPQA